MKVHSTTVTSEPYSAQVASPSSLESGKPVGLARTPIALFIYALAWGIVLWAAIALPSLEDASCFGVLGFKHQVLDSAGSPKIIFTGGSNLLFGLDGEKVERVYKRKVVDMGLCIMFPLSYLFEEIKDSIKAGDIVVLSPEYSSLSREFERSMVMADILDGYPRAIEWILKSNGCTWEEKGKILIHLRTLGLQKLQYCISHARQIVQHRATWSYNKPNPGLDVLNARNLNGCGDLVWHLNRPVDKNGIEKKILIRVPKTIDGYTISEIDKFASYCESRGAKFVLIPPPVPYSMYLKSKTDIDTVIGDARRKLSIPVLGSADRYTFPDGQIYGGHYHLDKIGREVRTERVIDDLRSIIDAAGKPQ